MRLFLAHLRPLAQADFLSDWLGDMVGWQNTIEPETGLSPTHRKASHNQWRETWELVISCKR